MTERFGPQQLDSPDHLVITAPPVRIPAMPVVGHAVTVDRDADLDTVLCEQLTEFLVQLDTISMDPEIQLAHTAQHGMQGFDYPA